MTIYINLLFDYLLFDYLLFDYLLFDYLLFDYLQLSIINYQLSTRPQAASRISLLLVTGMHAVELFEDFAEVFFLDALTGVADGEIELLLVVPGADIDVEGLVLLAVLHGIVHEVGNGVLEVYLIDEDG